LAAAVSFLCIFAYSFPLLLFLGLSFLHILYPHCIITYL
jgi:hypothetical protein